MIIYASTKAGFSSDVLQGTIDQKILHLMQIKSRGVGQGEVKSWRNSLQFMLAVLQDPDIPDEAGIALEYHLPNSGKRIDLLISGGTTATDECLIIVELKQWETARSTGKPSVVSTDFRFGAKEVAHPSYQAWSYAQLFKDFNAVVQDEHIGIQPCAYLHNYTPDGVIDGEFYREDLDRAPLFLKTDALRLREFIKKWVRYPDKRNVLYRMDQGKIRPSKNLSDSLVSLLNGAKEFTLIDEQKVAYETALALLTSRDQRTVLIVHGGPGTGKSVVAINLLVEIIRRGRTCQYVTKNAAPRAVYEAKLSGHLRKSQISNLFVGSGAFHSADQDSFDVLLVDEAHRLNAKSGIFSNLGENQIKEIMLAAKNTVFFIDEDQRVTMKDIGTSDEVRKWAKLTKAKVIEVDLPSQFRCNGSDGYIAWLDNSLQIRGTANPTLDGVDYEFKVFRNPNDLHAAIAALNSSNRARIVAGYCWDWRSKNDPSAYDISIPEFGYKRQWNLSSDGGLWILQPDSVEQVGCIHTCQGLEVDYIGVIIGPDFLVRDAKVITDFRARSKMDQSLKGIKSKAKVDEEAATALADQIIKNTYRTLMSRGAKGCFVYCTDQLTGEYFSSLTCSTRYATGRAEEKLMVADGKRDYKS